MKVLTGSVAYIIHFIADDAKKRFKNLRARYTRDKNKVTKKKKSGGGTDEVQDAKKETSELYPYLGSLDSHVTRRRRSKGSLVRKAHELKKVMIMRLAWMNLNWNLEDLNWRVV